MTVLRGLRRWCWLSVWCVSAAAALWTTSPSRAQMGACCTRVLDSNRFECTMRTASECCAVGGTPYGERVVCSPSFSCRTTTIPPVPCPTGACCTGSGDGLPGCDIRTLPECCAAGGQYYGDATVCTPIICGSASTVSCPLTTGSSDLRSGAVLNRYLDLNQPGTSPVTPSTTPPGGLCGMGGAICAPNPFGKGQFKFELTEVRDVSILLGDGPPPAPFVVVPSSLTAAGAFGLGERGGYPTDPCPAAGPRAGTFWPFRDAAEVQPGGMCMNGDGFMVTPFSGGFGIMMGGQARGGPAETLPGFPTGLDQLNRGVIDERGNVLFGAFDVRGTRSEQTLARLRLGAGCVDINVQDPASGQWIVQRNVQLVPKTELLVVGGSSRLVDGAAVNGLAAFFLGEYSPTPLALQDTNTSAGDEIDDDNRLAKSSGSELDGMYASIVMRDGNGREIPPSLRLFLSGNLASELANTTLGLAERFANLEIFFDTIEGAGQHTLRGDNADVAGNALNRMGAKSPGNGNTAPGPDGPGLTFEPGCDPDFYTTVSLRTSEGTLFDLNVSHATLPTGGAGQGWFVGKIRNGEFLSPGTGVLTGGNGGSPAIRASICNANFDGVTAGEGLANQNAARDVKTGVELLIPLSAIGNPTRSFKIVAFINGQEHGFVSNQVLPGIGGGAALGEPRRVDFGLVRNVQCAAVYPPKQPLWKNGDFDRRSAQLSMVGADQDWNLFARITADDFYLCDGQLHAIDVISGSMNTNAAIPKAAVVVWEDCDGRPNLSRPITILSAAPQALQGRGLPLGDGEVTLRDEGAMFDGLHVIHVEARFSKPLFLRGGTYWVSIIGFSGTANPLDEFFWGTAGDQIVKGRPGQFYDSDVRAWEDIDLLCCGCTDFDFCIGGESCKILLDNAAPRAAGGAAWATPSLQNGTRTSDKSRSASDVVAPPCSPVEVCYVEGYVWTNCDRVGLEFHASDCGRPASRRAAVGPYLADCIIDTGERASAPGSSIELRLLKVIFFRFPTFQPEAGTDFWVSLFALGDNAQSARGYFALGDRCDRTCDRLFNAPFVRGPAYDQSLWVAASPEASRFDHAMMVAVRESAAVPPLATVSCEADVNQSGTVTVQDLFDFLALWFAGCP